MKERILQFGGGGFLRGFADWMLQLCHDRAGFDGGVVVVQSVGQSSPETGFTHVCRGLEGVEYTKVDVISRFVRAADFDGYIALAENPDFRFVISNTTEAGIAFSEKDAFDDRPAKTFPGKLTQLMHRRFALGLPGFVFLPCELIDRNGDALKECVLKYARLWNLGDGFVRWVEEENVFANTLVDRINTGWTDDAQRGRVNASEFFHLWVIEGCDRLFDEIPFDKCGLNVILTDNLEMYRTRKVRILNGAHTSMVPYALLEGLDTVKSAMDDGKMRAHLEKCVFEEIIPTLDLPAEELEAYARDVLTRFANPYIRHELKAISLNSVSKFRVRVLPSILEYIRRFDKAPEGLMLSFAKLIEFYKRGAPSDLPEVMEFMKTATVDEILKNEELWGQDLSFLESELKKYADLQA